jgi:hypothetical protein
MGEEVEDIIDIITSMVSAVAVLYLASRIISMVTAYAYPTAPSPAPSPAPTPTPTPTPTPPPSYTPSITISASKSSLSEDPNDSVTVTVCWSNYTSPPGSGDYYNVRASSDTEGCNFDFVLLPKDRWNTTSCGNFARRFLDTLEGGNPYFPCLGVLRGCIDNNCSQNTVTVSRASKYSISDVSGLEYDPSAGNVNMVFAKDVTNMAIIIMSWTADVNGNACRGLIDPSNTAKSKGLWVSTANQRYQLFTGIYPQDIKTDSFVCSEKYVVVRVYRPDGYKELKAQMR